MAEKEDIAKEMEDFNLDDVPTPPEGMSFEKSFEVFEEEEKVDPIRLKKINDLKETFNTVHGSEYAERYLRLKQISKLEKNMSVKKEMIYSSKTKADELISNYKGSYKDVEDILNQTDIDKKANLLLDYLTKNKIDGQFKKAIAYYAKNDPEIEQPAPVNSEDLNKILNSTRKLKSEADRLNIQIQGYFDHGQREKAIQMAIEMGSSPERHKHVFKDEALIEAYNKGYKVRNNIAKEYGNVLNQYTLSYQQNLAYKGLRDKFSGLVQFQEMAMRYIIVAEHLKEKGKKPSIIEVSDLASIQKNKKDKPTFDELFKDKDELKEKVRQSINEIEGNTVDEKLLMKLVSYFDTNISNHMTVQFAYDFKEVKLNVSKVVQEMFLLKEKYPDGIFYQLENISGKNSIDKQIRELTNGKHGFSTAAKYSDNGKSIVINRDEANGIPKPIIFVYSEDDMIQRDFYKTTAQRLGLKENSSILPAPENMVKGDYFKDKWIMEEIDGFYYKLLKLDEGFNGQPETGYYQEIFDEELINEFIKTKEQKLDNEKILEGFKKVKPELEEQVKAIELAVEEVETPIIQEEKKEPSIGNLDIQSIDADHRHVHVYLKNMMVVNAVLEEIDNKYKEEKKNLLSKAKDFEDKVLLEKALLEKYYGFDEELVSNFAKDKLQRLEGKKSELPDNINEYFADKYLNDKETINILKMSFPFISDVEKRVNEKIRAEYNQTLKDPHEAMHNATVSAFSKEFKLDQEQTKKLFSKENILSVAGTALKGTSLVINPAGFAVSQIVKGLMKTQAFEDFKDRIGKRVDTALNTVGITQGSATRKYLTIGAGLAAGAALGAYLVVSNDIGVDDIKAISNKFLTYFDGTQLDSLSQNATITELSEQHAEQLNKELLNSRPPVEQFTTNIDNVIQPATSREISEQLIKGFTTPEFEAKLAEAGYRMSDIEMALNQNINEQMLQGKFPAETTIELVGAKGELIGLHLNADQLSNTKTTLEAAMAKTQMITNGTIIHEIPNPETLPEKTVIPVSNEHIANSLGGQVYSDIPAHDVAKPEDIAKALDSQAMVAEVKAEDVVAQPVQLATVEVKAGDSLYEIAEKQLGTNATPEKINNLVAAISSENNIKNPNLIYIGDTLKIPDIENLQPVELKVAFSDPTDLYTNNLYLPPSGVDNLAAQMADTYIKSDIDPQYRDALVDKFKDVIQYHSDGEPYANLSNNSFRYDVSQVVLEIQQQAQVAEFKQEIEEELEKMTVHRARGIQI